MRQKDSETGQQHREAFIEFKDKNKHTDGWYKIIELNAGYITFLTSNNKITIPMIDVERIKERGVCTE